MRHGTRTFKQRADRPGFVQCLRPDDAIVYRFLDAPNEPSTQRDLVHAAERTGLAGLLLAQQESATLSLSTEPLARLRRSAALVAGRNVNALAQLADALGTLDRAGIDALLLKGAALQRTLYDRPDLRPMSDVDLLVRPEDGCRARDTLLENGWHEGQALVRSDFFPRFYYATELHSAKRIPVRMDLHVRPFRPLRLACTVPDNAFWEAADRIVCNGQSVFVPSPERMLIHLAAHAAYHGLSRFIWLYDIHAFVARYGDTLNWQLLATLANRWRLGPAVRMAMDAAIALCDTPLPREAASAIANCKGNWIDRWCLRQAPRDAAAPARHVFVNWATTPNRKRAYAYLFANVLPGPQHLQTIYSKRHAGWRLVAMVLRLLRVPSRAMANGIRRAARLGPDNLLHRPLRLTDTK